MAEAALAPGFLKINAGLRPLLLLVGIAAAVAAGVGVVLWAQGPTYNLLYGDLASEDAASVTQALTAAGIQYRLENGTGAISVPIERINDARLLLAGQGLPAVGRIRRDGEGPRASACRSSWKARATSMRSNRSSRAPSRACSRSRAHACISRHPRSSSFVRDRVPASASVFLQLNPAARSRANRSRPSSIWWPRAFRSWPPHRSRWSIRRAACCRRRRVATNSPSATSSFEFARQMEEGYSQRIEALISPLVGPGRVRAQVSAQFDMSATEEAREQYRPGQPDRAQRTALRGDHRLRWRGNRRRAGRADEPAARAGRRRGPAAGRAARDQWRRKDARAAAADANSSRQQTRNYEIDRTVAYTRQPAGKPARGSRWRS